MAKGKRSNKSGPSTSSLNARINAIRKDINPLMKVRACRGNPKPFNKNKTVYVTRTYGIEKTAASGTASFSVTDLLLTIVPGGDPANITDVRVSMIKLWNCQTGSSLTASAIGSVLTDPGSDAPSIQGVDYGTQSSLAGLCFDIPDTLARDITAVNPQSSNFVTCTTGGTSDKVLMQVTCRISV